MPRRRPRGHGARRRSESWISRLRPTPYLYGAILIRSFRPLRFTHKSCKSAVCRIQRFESARRLRHGPVRSLETSRDRLRRRVVRGGHSCLSRGDAAKSLPPRRFRRRGRLRISELLAPAIPTSQPFSSSTVTSVEPATGSSRSGSWSTRSLTSSAFQTSVRISTGRSLGCSPTTSPFSVSTRTPSIGSTTG
jgi:hypothetical protein